MFSFLTKLNASKLLVTAPWLRDNLRGVSILDCSWYLPTQNRNSQQEFIQRHIPGARFFDIDLIKDSTKTELPHMLPLPEYFGANMDKFGISRNSRVILYDTSGGIGPACRVLWTFHAMGHHDVSVLDGGMAQWKYETEHGWPEDQETPPPGSRYVAEPIKELVSNYADIIGNIEQLKVSQGKQGRQLVDARPAGRFAGTDPEPRAGLSSGHMPYSFNVPFNEVTDKATDKLKQGAELRQLFEQKGIDLGRPITTTCGSGVTASVLYFALLNAGVSPQNLSVYDGSWTEYALNPHSEIVKQ